MSKTTIIGTPIEILWESETQDAGGAYTLTQLLVTEKKGPSGSNLFFLNFIKCTSTRGHWVEGDHLTRILRQVSPAFALSKNRKAIIYLSDQTLENIAFHRSWTGSEHLMGKPEAITRAQKKVHKALMKRFKTESKVLISKKNQTLQKGVHFKVADYANSN